MRVFLVCMSENINIRGVERYSIQLLLSLLDDPSITSVTILAGSWQKYLFGISHAKLKVIKVEMHNHKIIRHLFHYFVLPFYFRHYDCVHITNTNPLLFKFGKPVVVTIHDIAEYFVPEKYGVFQAAYRKWLTWLVSTTASHIITDSNYSKTSIVEQFSLKDDAVSSIYLGLEHFAEDLSDEPPEHSSIVESYTRSEFFLFWGVIEKSKGVLETIHAFIEFKQTHPNSNKCLIICGRAGNAIDDVNELIASTSDVFWLGHVSDDDLIFLTKKASAVLFPSRYEGFGLPALEGFIHNDNIVASKTTSLGEVTRDFAWQVEPQNISKIAHVLSEISIHPKKFTESSRTKILSRFSWKTCAILTCQVYEKVIKENE